MKRVLIGVGVCLVVFIVVDVVIGARSPDQWAGETALDRIREEGHAATDLTGLRSEIRGSLFGRTAEVTAELKKGDERKTVRVTMRKYLNVLGWKVVDYREEPAGQ
jgi:hypothetical protein